LTESKPHVLIVDDEANVRRVLGTLLDQAGYQTTRVADGAAALDVVRAQDPDLVLTDLAMPGMDGMELLARLKVDFPEIPVVMLTAHGSVEAAVEAMKRGAFDFLTKPFEKAKVVETIDRALRHGERSRREFQGPLTVDDDCGLVGRSAPMDELRRMIRKVGPSPSTVLVTGETGTGKELVADALHRLSPRSDGAMVKVNCGALPETLAESELFGHERGAFTGAERDRPGRFELADGGTLFLDEVGELAPAVQVKLLRVLEDGRVDRVGGSEPRAVDVRLVAATHRDLGREVQDGRFREDLLYRLSVVEVRVPALRERTGDVPLLVEFFLDKHARRLDRPRPEIASEAMKALSAQPWPGNVRQLENAVERAVLLGEGDVLGPDDFDLGSFEREVDGPASAGDLKSAARQAAAREERRLISEALEATGGNVTRAAEKLGLSRRGLQIKMKELGLRGD
jgi:DNA-binding NtrC family response regulator